MRLQHLQLTNFRQFRTGSITFADGGSQNVTVIHGQNGSGKTTLINELTWILYNEVQFTLRPEKLGSQGAFAEAEPGDSIRVTGVLEFEDEGIEYQLTRWVEYQKQSENDFQGEIVDDDVTLDFTEQDGSRGKRNNPQDSIQQILPERLSELFFFDGEYITRLSETQSQNEIRDSIQNIMGLKIIERSIRHLESVEDRFENDLQRYANTELNSLIERRQRLEGRKEDQEQALDSAKKTRDQLNTEISEIKEALEHIGESANLEKERSEIEEELEQVEDRIEKVNDKIENSISTKGHLPFVMPAVKETAKDLDRLRDQGAIPSEMSNQFIDQLLESQQCICGRPLEPDTDAYKSVESFKADAVTEGFDQAAVRIISHLTQLDSESREYFDTISESVSRRSELRDRKRELAEEISEISSQLERIDTVDPETGETPSELENARDKKATEVEEAKERIIRTEIELEELEVDLKEVNEEIDDARQEKEEADLARKRMRATESVRHQLENSFGGLQERVRDWSNKLVSETFDKIATKEYSAEITDEFELRIKDQLGDQYLEVEKSRGERQIASLTFIGSLVEIARERYESSRDSEYFSGGIYPIVMDSPFGALDDDHRRQVSRVIPSMAEQVVVLVTDSQWRGPVANELSEIASQQYQLSFDPGEGSGNYPKAVIEDETTAQEAR